MDSLVAKYLNVLNEDINKNGVVKNAVPKPGADLFGTPKAEDSKKQSENVDIETPEEDKDNSCEECDGEPAKLNTKVESLNPFDELYNKILKEETFGWAMEEDEEEESAPEDHEFSNDQETEETASEENEEEGLHAVLKHLKSAVEALQGLLDEADQEGEENEEGEGNEGNEEGEEINEEGVEAETLGHALVDQEKLTGGLTSKNNIVKSGVNAVKKKAEVPSTNKGHDGEVKKENESAGKQLSGKNNKVDGVKVGNFFNNK